MKKVIVVCRAGPKPRRWLRPMPTSWHRNSFRPLESRNVRGTMLGLVPGPVFIAFAGGADAAVATRPRADANAGRGKFWLLPLRNLSNRLISVGTVTAGFHGQRLER